MDWELTCRVCLEGGEMVSLFDSDENNELLSEKYKFTTGIEVTEADTLPTLICLTCVDRLMFAYQFKQQCVTSNDTLQECLQELNKSNASATVSSSNKTKNSELVTIKQENGVYVQYELPIENEGGLKSVVTSAPPERKRGRPRKYPNKQGEIVASPYKRKKAKETTEEPSLSTILASGGLKKEPSESGENVDWLDDNIDDDDPEYEPGADAGGDDDDEKPTKTPRTPGKRKVGRPAKRQKATERTDDGEDILLKETIMAYSEPLASEVKERKPRKPRESKATVPKKLYAYEKSHTCETCGNSFRSNASLQAHIRRHLGIKPYVCSVCNYSCVLSIELRRHMLRHTGVRPYKCRICERRFGDFGSRQKHERLHLGERPYQCNLCGKSFTYSYVLSNHMLTHTGEKKFSCEPCHKKFTKAHHLKYHNKVHHKELYMQQQMAMEAKRMREQIKISDLSSVLTNQLLEGRVQLIQTGEEGGEVQLQVMGEIEDDGEHIQENLEEEEQGEHDGQIHYTYSVSQEDNQMDIQMDSMTEEESELIVGDLN